MTRKPAASRTLTAAWAVSGWKWLLKVSGQRRTGGAAPEGADEMGLLSASLRRCPDTNLSGRVRWNQALKVSGAKAGIERCVGIPAISLARSRSNGVCVVKLARAGAMEAMRAQRSMLPKA